MSQFKCPFSSVQASGSCHCSLADQVIRRGGSEFDCRDAEAHALCTSLVRHINSVALPALGYADDLTQTPKSIYERILLGGLQGLRRAQDPQDTDPDTADIRKVVDAARLAYSSMENIPQAAFVPAIEACFIRKRHGKRR